jgi:hypothetical protein
LYNLLYKYTLPSLMLKHPLELKCLLDCCYFNCVNRVRTKKEYPPCSKPTSIAANLLRLLLCGPFELLPSNGFQRSAARPLNGPQTDRCHHQLDKKKEREREKETLSLHLSLFLFQLFAPSRPPPARHLKCQCWINSFDLKPGISVSRQVHHQRDRFL